MKNQNIILILFLLNLIISSTKSNTLPEIQIHPIISATLNGTSAFVSFENLNNNESYLYFSFDFKFHHSAVKQNFNTAYFLISSDQELNAYNQEKIKFGFLEQNWDEIKTEDDIKNIKWKRMKLIRKENPYEEFNYYFRIKRRKIKMNTAIIRIPVNERKEGGISVENILELPDFGKNETNNDL